MGILLSIARKFSLISEINAVESQVMGLRRKLRDITGYVSKIADGKVSINDLMNCPGTYLGAMSVFMVGSHQMAQASAQQKMQYMMQVPGAMPQIQDPQMQQQYMMVMQKNFYEQARKEAAHQVEEQAQKESVAIEQELASANGRLSMLQEEKKQVDQEAKESVKSLYA